MVAGVARHKDGKSVRHVLERLGELWRRSGGKLERADGEAVRDVLRLRLAGVTSLDDFQRADLSLALDEFVAPERRRELEALPSHVMLHEERCALDYEVEEGRPIVRIRMKEHMVRMLHPGDIPQLDRPVAFSVVRGKHASVRANSLGELRKALSAAGRPGPRRSGLTRRHRRRP
jgi:ATP-dependent helicase HrpA